MINQQAVQHAREVDPQLVMKAERMAVDVIGREMSVRQGRNRITGKITACEFAGLSRKGRSSVSLWEVTVTHDKGGYITGFYSRLPRK